MCSSSYNNEEQPNKAAQHANTLSVSMCLNAVSDSCSSQLNSCMTDLCQLAIVCDVTASSHEARNVMSDSELWVLLHSLLCHMLMALSVLHAHACTQFAGWNSTDW